MIYVNYKKRYQNFIPEERINRIKNSNYNIKLAPGESIVLDNTLLENHLDENELLHILGLGNPFEFLTSLENFNYSISYKPFIYDYLDCINDYESSNNCCSSLKERSNKIYNIIKMVEKEMEFENELHKHYLVLYIGNFKVIPICEINKKILKILGTCNITFYLEEHDGVVKPFYNIHLKNESFVSDFSIKTGSLDFKNDGLFINSLIKMLENNNIKGFSFDQVKEAPLEYLQMIQVLKY